MLQTSTETKEFLCFGHLEAALLIVFLPLTAKPDDFGLLLIDTKEDCSEVFIGWSARNAEIREGRTEKLVTRTIILLACFRAVAGALASAAETSIGFITHRA